MIIGKSLTALGGGGLKPEIIVTAKAGALLNLHYKDSSIILQSYQLGTEETQHTFVVSVSEMAYVVEDVTNGKSMEVLVDAAAVFEINLSYTSLIPEISIVNGTEIGLKRAYDRSIGYAGSNGTAPQYDGDVISWTFYSSADYHTSGIVYTAPVNINSVSKIKANISLGVSTLCSIVVLSGYEVYEADFYRFDSTCYIATDYKTLSAGDHDIELDVSGVSGNAYVGFITRANGSKNSISALNLFI